MQNNEQEFSLKSLFIPLTTFKAIHIIIIVGFLVFANMLFNNFVWDDKMYIIRNPQVHYIDLAASFRESFFNASGHYRPLPAIYFSLLFRMFAEVPFFYHFIQLLLHIINTILLLLFFRKFFSIILSLSLSLLFIVHPIQVEAVSYIAAAGNPLFFLFGMIALFLSTDKWLNKKRLIMILILLLLSALTRETGLIFIALIILYRYLFNRKQILTITMVGVIVTLLYFMLRFGVGNIYFHKLEFPAIANLSLVERIINIPSIIFYYIKTIFFPLNLLIDQQWIVTSLTLTDFYILLVLDSLFFIIIIILGIVLFRRNKALGKQYIFFFCWFLLGLLMHLQLFPLDATVSDRWMYFPIAGLFGMFGIALYNLFHNKSTKSVVVVLLIILIVLSARTFIRNTNWSNGLTLFINDSRLHDNFDIQNNIGAEFAQQGNYDEAIKHYKKSIALLSNDINLYNIGDAYEQKGDFQNAKIYYYRLLQNNKSRSAIRLFAYQRLGAILIFKDNSRSAIEILKAGIKEYPNDGKLWSQLAISEYYFGDQNSAIDAATRALELMPNSNTQYIYRQILNKKPIKLR